MKIDNQILEVLNKYAEIDNNSLKLTCGQLDRKTYLAVNKILEAIGGKWNRKTQSHIFESNVEDRLERVLLTGQVDIPKSENFGYFPTPKIIVNQMLELADIKEGMSVLEPSAGQGHIIGEIKTKCNLTIIENLQQNIDVLKKKGYEVIEQDFLTFTGKFDRIIMNPPFERQQDIDHVLHAFELLKTDGVLVSIMASGALFRENKKTKQFRELLETHGNHIELEEKSFKESGTCVNTIMVILEK